ncbi:hypothetical protein Q1695_005791 [Nippostrongylus brasiliensis]|nr:hypothetical protein Q1695_005791 [Nippostrongylus brasiliensis]
MDPSTTTTRLLLHCRYITLMERLSFQLSSSVINCCSSSAARQSLKSSADPSSASDKGYPTHRYQWAVFSATYLYVTAGGSRVSPTTITTVITPRTTGSWPRLTATTTTLLSCPVMLDTLRKRLSLWITFNKSKDEQYHPREEERLHEERLEKRVRDKQAARHAQTKAGKKSKKHNPHLYEKKQSPSYSSLENATSSAFHRSSPVCRKLRVNSKTVM